MILEDVQARADDRQLPIDEAGVTGIKYPVTVWDRSLGKQQTIAEIRMSVDVRPEVKGAHLSRFMEILDSCAHDIGPDSPTQILYALRERLGSVRAALDITFPYFLRRQAPITGAAAFLDYLCTLSARLDDSSVRLELSARVPVTSVCPCSKAISDYGAHNQRSYVTISMQPKSYDDWPTQIWFDDLIKVAEASASSPIFPILKRVDERHVTMRAHDNPVFVEDMAREVAKALKEDERIASFRVEVVSDESIHNHGAFARIRSPRSSDLTRFAGQ